MDAVSVLALGVAAKCGKGEKGDKGDPGVSMTVGTTTTGEAGTQASVTNTGTTSDPILNFTIPKGDKGDKGDTGEQGIQGPKGDTGSQGPKGDTGETGPKGDKGDTGLTGPQGPAGRDGAIQYTAGTNITISADNVISATGGGTTYTAGDNIQIEGNVISATDTTYTAGDNITIENGVISATGGGSEPSAYLKSASVSGNTLTITNKDDTTVEFTPEGGGSSAGAVRYDTEQELTNEQFNTVMANLQLGAKKEVGEDVYGSFTGSYSRGVTVMFPMSPATINKNFTSGNIYNIKVNWNGTDYSFLGKASSSSQLVCSETEVEGQSSEVHLDLGDNYVSEINFTNSTTIELRIAGVSYNTHTITSFKVYNQSTTITPIDSSLIPPAEVDLPLTKGTGTNSIIIGETDENKKATGEGAINAIQNTTTYGYYDTNASGSGSVIIGAGGRGQCTASGAGSVIISGNVGGVGMWTASGSCSIAGGDSYNMAETTASGRNSIAFGFSSAAYGNVQATKDCSFAFGHGVKSKSECQFVHGKPNVADSASTYAYIIGNGTSDSARSNAFTVDWSGNVVAAGTVTPTGADYCEYFEFEDGNPDNEDRVGMLVSLDNGKIKFANDGDDILGITTGTKGVIGDAEEMNWSGKYVKDDFGRIQYIDYDVVHEEGTEQEWTEHVHTKKISDDYDPTREYTPRSKRKEWYPVGLLGKVFVKYTGELKANDYITANNGIAVKSETKTNMRVLEIVNDNVARVLVK